MPFLPVGSYYQPTAYRSDLTGMMKGLILLPICAGPESAFQNPALLVAEHLLARALCLGLRHPAHHQGGDAAPHIDVTPFHDLGARGVLQALIVAEART